MFTTNPHHQETLAQISFPVPLLPPPKKKIKKSRQRNLRFVCTTQVYVLTNKHFHTKQKHLFDSYFKKKSVQTSQGFHTKLTKSNTFEDDARFSKCVYF